jgi:hypothetical protein
LTGLQCGERHPDLVCRRQLMYSEGLTVLDLRNTLPNLKSLILSLSFDPSHSSVERTHVRGRRAFRSRASRLRRDFSASTLAVPALFTGTSRSPSPLSSTSTFESAAADELEHSSPPTSASNGDDEHLLALTEEEDRPTPSLSLADALAKRDSVHGKETEGDRSGPHSPSTLRTLSIRSTSPAPTLTGGKPSGSVSNGKAKGNGREVEKVVQSETSAEEGKGKGKGNLAAKGKGSASSSAKLPARSRFWTAVGYGE